MLRHVTFANEQMMANLSRQHLPFTPSKLSQKCGGWYVYRGIINKSRQAGNIPCGSVYFCTILSSSPIQSKLSLTTPHFSLFVLELLFPNRKAEVIFHYLFWNFRSQIEKRNLVGQNELSLATAQFFYYSIWNFRVQIEK